MLCCRIRLWFWFIRGVIDLLLLCGRFLLLLRCGSTSASIKDTAQEIFEPFQNAGFGGALSLLLLLFLELLFVRKFKTMGLCGTAGCGTLMKPEGIKNLLCVFPSRGEVAGAKELAGCSDLAFDGAGGCADCVELGVIDGGRCWE